MKNAGCVVGEEILYWRGLRVVGSIFQGNATASIRGTTTIGLHVFYLCMYLIQFLTTPMKSGVYEQHIKAMPVFTKVPETLKHFTNVGRLRSILNDGFQFSIPANWEDENDSTLIKLYETHKQKRVFVFCLCKGGETLHHWSYYGNPSRLDVDIEQRAKCCIKLNRNSFLQALKKEKFIIRDVQYKYISDLENGKHIYTIDDLLTLKRKAYSVDDELRIIDIENNKYSTPPTIDITPYIDKIVLDGKLNDARYHSLSQSLMNEFPFLECKIEHSTLYRSANWIKAATKIANQQSKHTI